MSRDLRAYSRQTTVRLVVGFFILLFLLGDGLIYLFYGRGAAITGLICLVAALLPLVLIWASLALIGWVVRRTEQE